MKLINAQIVKFKNILDSTPAEIEPDVTCLKQFPAYLNRWDSQQARNEGVFAH
jgi:hypothetical protein